jgi:shikimate kinase
MTDENASSLKFRAQTNHRLSVAVALVGFMGAGKTTVGSALAARLNWRFLDLDDLIQAQTGRTIAEIFEQRGESIFREAERLALNDAVHCSRRDATVLSLGGGAFIDNTNQALLRENEIPAVFLDAPAEELFLRCAQPQIVRPLRHDRDQFFALYEQRRPTYLKAEICISTAGREIQAIVEEIISGLGLETSSGVLK